MGTFYENNPELRDYFESLPIAVKNRILEARIPIYTVEQPVSYTHLDVYKRQTLKTLMVPVDGQNCVNSLKDFLYNCKKCKMS